MDARLLYRGRELLLFVLADGEREFAREFVDQELTKVQQDQVRALLKRAADQGLPRNTEQFRVLRGHSNLAEFKRFGVRLMCFFDGPRRIVITHGFKKQTDRTPPEEIDRALRLRDAFFRDRARDE